MRLSQLDRYVPAKLYKRGVDYFDNGYVESLVEDAPNRWHAVVSGTQNYYVSIYLADTDSIRSTSCTCPFESDSLCKHEVAVCLAIEQHKEENVSETVDVLPQLKALKKAELLDLLEDLLQQQPAVNSYLMEKLSTKNGMDEAMARRIIRKSATRARRHGFIEWDRTDIAIEGVREVQEFISTLDPQLDDERMIRLSLVAIHECGEMLAGADDSSGSIGMEIGESLSMIRDILARWTTNFDEAKADRMLELFFPEILYHLEQDMTNAAADLVDSVMVWSEQSDYGTKLFEFIESIAKSGVVRNKTYSYELERLRLHQLEILLHQGDSNAVEAFVHVHRAFPGIRKVEALEALHKGEFETAIRLCKGSERIDAEFRGLVADWKELRYEVYEQAGHTSDMVHLAFELAAGGEQKYYEELKGLVSAEDWPETVGSLLEELRKQQWTPRLYVDILIGETMQAELLDYCRSHVAEIESLYPHLLESYPHDVNELFTTHIYQLIHSASDRKKYKAACGKIKLFKKALGAEAATSLVEELKFMYPKRKALLDELSKI